MHYYIRVEKINDRGEYKFKHSDTRIEDKDKHCIRDFNVYDSSVEKTKNMN